MIKFNKKIFTVTFFLLTHLSVSATLIPTDLTITASIGLGGGIFIDSETSNSGSFSIGANTGTVTDLVVAGDNTSGVSLTDTDETVKFDTDIDSTSLDDNTYAYDFGLQLSNNHATDSFSVDFSFDYTHMVNSLVTGYSRSNISLFDNDGEFFFSDIVSDADFGNTFNGVLDPQGAFGGIVNDAGLYLFSYTLLAGENINFNGFVEAFFGYTDGVNGIKQTSNATLSIVDVNQIQVGQPPVGVPEPSSLILFLTVLILCVRTQSKRI
ncbi:MAG: hypothetical protein ACI9LM_003466 [Alteromonadaceae bacterium]|jgi:hypothetical protein